LKYVVSLRGRKAFRGVLVAGRVFESRRLKFFYARHAGHPGSIRIGIIVGKGHGSAARRNLVKRRIREACRRLIDFNPGETQHTLSIVVVYGGSKRQVATRVTFDEIKDDVIKFGSVIRTLLASNN
jgi:ribonuclease P protein component